MGRSGLILCVYLSSFVKSLLFLCIRLTKSSSILRDVMMFGECNAIPINDQVTFWVIILSIKARSCNSVFIL